MSSPILYLILSLSCMITAGALSAQQVIAPSGGHFSSNNAQMSATLGEPVIETATDQETTLTQGFHQSKLTVTGLEESLPHAEVKVYPNPTADMLKIDFKEEPKDLDLIVTDAAGKLVYSEQGMSGSKHSIDMSKLSNGTYFLLVLNRQDMKQRNTYQIIKSN